MNIFAKAIKSTKYIVTEQKSGMYLGTLLVAKILEFKSGKLKFYFANINHWDDLNKANLSSPISDRVIAERKASKDFKWIDEPKTRTKWEFKKQFKRRH